MLVGIALIAVGVMLGKDLSAIPYRWWNREGYREATGEIVALAGGKHAWNRVRIVGDTTEVSLSDAQLPPNQSATFPVWHNPAAHLNLGILRFDERILAKERVASLPGIGLVVMAITLPIASICLGCWVVRMAVRRGT